jgi:hypothetical protein
VVGPAAFLALIWPRLKAGRTERLVALGGVAIALATTNVLPVGVPVILAATAALAGALAAPAAASSPAAALRPGETQASGKVDPPQDDASRRETSATTESASPGDER